MYINMLVKYYLYKGGGGGGFGLVQIINQPCLLFDFDNEDIIRT